MTGIEESRGILSFFADPMPWLDDDEAQSRGEAGYYLALVLGDLALMASGGTVSIIYKDVEYSAGGAATPPEPPAQVGVIHSEVLHSLGETPGSYDYLEKDQAYSSPEKIFVEVTHAF